MSSLRKQSQQGTPHCAAGAREEERVYGDLTTAITRSFAQACLPQTSARRTERPLARLVVRTAMGRRILWDISRRDAPQQERNPVEALGCPMTPSCKEEEVKSDGREPGVGERVQT